MKPQLIDAADLDQAEHFVLESEPAVNASHDPAAGPSAHAVRKKIALRDRWRRHLTEIVLYEEGVLDISETRRGQVVKAHRLMLRYLDSVPRIEQRPARRLAMTALALGVLAVLAGLASLIDAITVFALPTALLAGLAGITTALMAGHMSHERIVFETLHGRSPALRLHAGYGMRRRFHALLPMLGEAIASAAHDIGSDTAVFLRQEMREHYRLRGDGVLTAEDCETGTCRILQQFDGPL